MVKSAKSVSKTEVITLYPYQEDGIAWLASKNLALLADEMGLGKTVQTICAADFIKAKRILIVCPSIARINWEREFTKFSSENRRFFQPKKETDSIWPETHSVIVSYDLAAKVISPGKFDLIVCDEAHLLKSITARRAVKILGKDGLIHKTKRFWALTGTPAPNHFGELWTLLFVFGVTKLAQEDFLNRYCNVRQTPFGPQVVGSKTSMVHELKPMLGKIMLRRKKEDVMKDLPPLTYTHFLVERGEVDLNAHQSFIPWIGREDQLKQRLVMENQMIKHILDNSGTHVPGMRALEAMAESVSTLRRYTGLQKLRAVADIVGDELDRNEYGKIVIFAVHRDVIVGAQEILKRHNPVTLFGGMNDETKQNNIDRFQGLKKYKIMIANIQSAGVAINLTAANQAAFIEQSWVPAENAQAIMRIHRMPQKEPCFIRFFGLAESIDDRVSNSLKRKAHDLTFLFDEKNPRFPQTPELT